MKKIQANKEKKTFKIIKDGILNMKNFKTKKRRIYI